MHRIRTGSPARVVSTLALVAAAFAASASAAPHSPYRYVSPVPGSVNVSPFNNIVLRDGRPLDRGTLGSAALYVTGSASGTHTGRLVLSDDERTLVFNPDAPFSPGETVAVRFGGGPRAISGEALPAYAFDFSVARTAPVAVSMTADDTPDTEEAAARAAAPLSASTPAPAAAASDLPAAYPPVTLLTSNNPDPGFVFCTPARNTPPVSNTHMLILDNNAMPIFYRQTASRPVDFKLLPDGRLLYFEIGKAAAYALDSNYAVVDSFRAGNGYKSDSHDTMVLPNDHCLLMIYDSQQIDMSQVVPGGNPDATVIGAVIQELDAAKNVVFQWRSWDHIPITDMNTPCNLLTDATVDYVHANSLDYDLDGNILLGSRYLNEVTKIDRQTGDIIWRFGQNAKQNQFTVIGDAIGFSDQHDAKMLPNGHLTVFDNHFCIDPKQTRCLEYDLDQVNHVATVVSAYRHVPDQLTISGGGFQRRENGGATIGWSNSTTPPAITELHADGSVAWEVQFWPPPIATLTYRACRYPWKSTIYTTDADSLDFGNVAMGDTAMLPLTVTNHSGAPLNLTSFVTLDSAFAVTDSVPITLPTGGSVTVHVRFAPTSVQDYATTLYVRSGTAKQLIAQPVGVRGRGEASTPAVFADFEAGWADGGVLVTWEFGSPGAFVSAQVQRADGASGPWAAIEGEPVRNGSTLTLLDRTAVPGRGYWYRIAGTTPGGEVVTSPAIAVAGRAAPVSGLSLAVAPNPGSRATVRFVVPVESRVRVSVVDAMGRTVAVLADGTRAAGEHAVTWNGATASGRAPAGLYWVRYDVPNAQQTRAFVLVR